MKYRVMTNGKSFKLQYLKEVPGNQSLRPWATTKSWHDVHGALFETKADAIKVKNSLNLPWKLVE